MCESLPPAIDQMKDFPGWRWTTDQSTDKTSDGFACDDHHGQSRADKSKLNYCKSFKIAVKLQIRPHPSVMGRRLERLGAEQRELASGREGHRCPGSISQFHTEL